MLRRRRVANKEDSADDDSDERSTTPKPEENGHRDIPSQAQTSGSGNLSPASTYPSPNSSPEPPTRDFANAPTSLGSPTTPRPLDSPLASTLASPPIRRPSRRFSVESNATGSPRARSASRLNRPEMDSSSSTWPLVITFGLRLLSFITGGDFLQDVVLLLFLVFYLRQLIKVPWELYTASRPRFSPAEDPSSTMIDSYARLRALELIYLLCSVISPLIGTILLSTVTSALGATKPLSWFSITLFALLAGYKPWMHLIERLQGHVEGLHQSIEDEVRDIIEEENEENDLIELKEKLQSLSQAHEETLATLTILERRAWKLERDRMRDRKRSEVMEDKIRGMTRVLASLKVNGIQYDDSGYSSGYGSTSFSISSLSVNPFVHPVIFSRALFCFLRHIVLAPLAVLFPGLFVLRERKHYKLRTVHFRPDLPTVEEISDEDRLPGADRQNGQDDFPDESTSSDSDDNSNTTVRMTSSSGRDKNYGTKRSHTANFFHIVIRTPAVAVGTFLRGVAKQVF